MDQNTIYREMVFTVSPERLWQAWTNPEELARWFAPEVELELRPGGRLRLGWPDQNDEAHGTVEIVDPPRRLVFRWRPFTADVLPSAPKDVMTTVEILIEPHHYGSILRLTESGFDGLEPAAMPRGIADNEYGWDDCLAALRSVVLGGDRT